MAPLSSGPPVSIRCVGLSWITGVTDDPNDLCAHGRVEVRVGKDLLVAPSDDQSVTVSAAALYLMRTLQKDHTSASRVGDQLFPCCGSGMWDVAEDTDVVITGCPNGIDMDVVHAGGDVILRTPDAREWRVALNDWKSAVFEFADQVSGFFAASSVKAPSGDDAPGFRKFLAEWIRRRGKPLAMGTSLIPE
jgi:hypothetical protein